MTCILFNLLLVSQCCQPNFTSLTNLDFIL